MLPPRPSTWAAPADRPAARVGLLVGLAAALLLALAPVVPAGASSSPVPQTTGFGPLAPSRPSGTPTPGVAPAPGRDDGEGRPAGALARAFRLVLAGAVLLGLAGAAGLYLTRERP